MESKIKYTLWFLILASLFQTACTFNYKNIEYDRAQRAIEKENYKKAVSHLSRVIKKEPTSKLALKSAREAARISLFETENFSQALDFFQHLVVYSNNPSERKEAQSKMAFIYSDKLAQYEQAIKEYSQLLSIKLSKEEVIEYKFSIAKAYFYLNNFFQADVEAKTLLELEMTDYQRFEVELFRANILLTTKKIAEAIESYKNIRRKHPNFSRREKVGMNIALAYEDINNFEKAIETLKEIRAFYPSPEFIDIKIRRLRKRMANLPGARKVR